MRPMLRCADERLKVKDGESRDSLSRLSGCIHTKRWCDVNRLLRHDASRVGEKMVVAVVVVVWCQALSREMCAQHAASFFEGGGGLLSGSANQGLKKAMREGCSG